MIRFRVASDISWADICAPISIAKMMRLLQDKDIAEVEVISSPNSVALPSGLIYITISNRDGSVTFRQMRTNTWEMVYHMIRVNPANCVCRLCELRKKRGSYPPATYQHLVENEFYNT